MLVVCVIYEGELLSNVTNTDVRLLSIDGRLLATAFGNQGSGQFRCSVSYGVKESLNSRFIF